MSGFETVLLEYINEPFIFLAAILLVLAKIVKSCGLDITIKITGKKN